MSVYEEGRPALAAQFVFCTLCDDSYQNTYLLKIKVNVRGFAICLIVYCSRVTNTTLQKGHL